ncbi:DUF2059 domain-containing protein [Oceanicola sp. S124]|uniref:DUF2059 domain-containing protein n=1 Tax=Oceanicola sp. S124 TaxID=1042378 RepID=UPI0002558508|nr:DUF2059 domain-containing protein [Oceanicola sp. S124]
MRDFQVPEGRTLTQRHHGALARMAASRTTGPTIDAQRMPDLRGAVLAMLGALVLLLAQALPGQSASREEARDFLKVTGFDAALESIVMSADNGPAMLGIDDRGFRAVWDVMAARVFRNEQIQTMALDMLSATLTADEMVTARDFYGSELGQRLVEVENASHLADDTGKPEAAAAALSEVVEGRDIARLSALERLISALDDTSDGALAMAEVQARFMIAARNAGVIELSVGDDALRDLIAGQFREMGEQDGLEAGMANAALTYRDFSTEEIDAYAAALEDPAMQRVYELMNAVQYEVMADRFEAAAALLTGAGSGEEL